MEHSSLVRGFGAAAGTETVTEVAPEAVWPLSSATLQVTVTVPIAAPVVERAAVEPVPFTVPEVEL